MYLPLGFKRLMDDMCEFMWRNMKGKKTNGSFVGC